MLWFFRSAHTWLDPMDLYPGSARDSIVHIAMNGTTRSPGLKRFRTAEGNPKFLPFMEFRNLSPTSPPKKNPLSSREFLSNDFELPQLLFFQLFSVLRFWS